jgi:FkbM family methyltransferase
MYDYELYSFSKPKTEIRRDLSTRTKGKSEGKPMAQDSLKVQIAKGIRRHFPKLWMERELRFRPNHFEPELPLVAVFCEKRKISIDVGANMGMYSYFMAKYSKSVIAFEPNIELWPALRRLLGRGFRLEAAALSDQLTKATLRLDRSNTGVATIEEKNNLVCVEDPSAVVSMPVETRTLDSYGLSNISMIKIDVEGHEEAVIRGAGKTIEDNRPVFIVESEDRHNPGAPRRLATMFSEFGYLGFYLKNKTLMDFNTLRNEDMDPKNLNGGDSTYINNFIYVPAEQSAKVERAKAFLSGR